MPNFKKSKNKMDSPYNLKPVPEGNKGKGLSKLPTEVRNKMGYQMDSSHSFKGKVANNMKTMYMGSVYYQTDPPSEENGEIIGLSPHILLFDFQEGFCIKGDRVRGQLAVTESGPNKISTIVFCVETCTN